VNLAELRRLAEAATPGPWRLDPVADGECHIIGGRAVVGYADERSALFIAAACPATVLALLDRLAAAEAMLANAVTTIETAAHWFDVERAPMFCATELRDKAARIAAHLAGKDGAK